ncbi:MAG: ABC transporter ATP-binding protein [Candidatus Limiplasma sp.]|nr:ABC transporter ATP-binding protein [Candidatus Limiplasma sp.]
MLTVKDLKTYFYTDAGCARAVDGVSFHLEKGHVLGIVGESGCGKSVTSLSVMGLLDPVTARVEGGQILFHDRDLLKLSPEEMRKMRGDRISMIYQEPMTSLNPVLTIGFQIEEALMLHRGMKHRQARERSIELLKLVGIPEPAKRVDEYPHQLSGGMRQRVMIAMALSCDPELLIADEPTTALDVTIQAQILALLTDLRERLGMSIIIISHDLGVIAEMADDVMVMYAGQVVEHAPAEQLLQNPKHPYTIGLMNSVPDITQTVDRLHAMDGLVPDLYHMPEGCRFAPRCDKRCEACLQGEIPLSVLPDGRQVRCVQYGK